MKVFETNHNVGQRRGKQLQTDGRFCPYQEFQIKSPGLYLLKFIVFVERHDQGDRVLAKSAEFNFKYTKTH